MNNASFIKRFLVTLVVVIVASIVAWQLWDYYMLAPWTRDGRVRADVVALAPDKLHAWFGDGAAVIVGDGAAAAAVVSKARINMANGG